MPIDQNQQAARRDSIRALLGQHRIRTQSELAERLRALGHAVTQSSVSRDLREMQVVKEAAGYRLSDAPAAPAAADSTFAFIREVTTAGQHLVVVKTATGAAQRVAVELDRSGWPEIVGTISGDDTIFIATASAAAGRRLQRRLAPRHGDAS